MVAVSGQQIPTSPAISSVEELFSDSKVYATVRRKIAEDEPDPDDPAVAGQGVAQPPPAQRSTLQRLLNKSSEATAEDGGPENFHDATICRAAEHSFRMP